MIALSTTESGMRHNPDLGGSGSTVSKYEGEKTVTDTLSGNAEPSIINSLRLHLADLVMKIKKEESYKADEEVFPRTIQLDVISGDDVDAYKGKSKNVFEAFRKSLESGTNKPELILDARKLLDVLVFTLSYARFGKDISVRTAAFLDFQVFVESFNDKLFDELTKQNGTLDLTGVNRSKAVKLMFYQGELAYFINNVNLRLRAAKPGDSERLTGITELMAAVKEDFEANKDAVSGILQTDENRKIIAKLIKNRSESSEERVNNRGKEVPIAGDIDVKLLEDSGWFNELDGLKKNSLNMHLHILANELARGHEDILGESDDTEESIEIVDRSLLDKDKYFNAKDLEAFKRASEFMIYHASGGTRELVNVTTLQYVLADSATFSLFLTTFNVNPEESKNWDLYYPALLKVLNCNYIGEDGLLLKAGEQRENDSVNLLQYCIRAYDLLQPDKSVPIYPNNFGVPMYPDIPGVNDTRKYYIVNEPTSKDFQGDTPRTTVNRIAAAKMAQYIVSNLSAPLKTVDANGEPIKLRQDVEGVGRYDDHRDYVDVAPGRRRYRAGNLSMELYSKVWRSLRLTSSPTYVSVAEGPISLMNWERRVPACLLVFLTGRVSDEEEAKFDDSNHQAVMIGTPNDKISALTLNDINEFNALLTNEYDSSSGSGDEGVVPPLVTAFNKVRMAIKIFKKYWDRAKPFWFSGTENDLEPRYRNFGRNAVANFVLLLGIHPDQLGRQNEVPFISGKWEDSVKFINDFLADHMGLLPNKEKGPTGPLRRLLYKGIYNMRVKFKVDHVKAEATSAANVLKAIGAIWMNPARIADLMSVYGVKDEAAAERLLSTNKQIAKYAEIYDSFFARRFLLRRLKYPLGKTGYIGLTSGTVIPEQTISAGEVWGIAHLVNNSSEIKSNKLTFVRAYLNETAKVLADARIRLVGELFTIGQTGEEILRFTVDPEYRMADGRGVTLGRKDCFKPTVDKDGNSILDEKDKEIPVIVTQLKALIDSKDSFHVDPFTSLRLISELNKLIKIEKDPEKVKILTGLATFWVEHVKGINVSSQNVSRVSRSGRFLAQLGRPDKYGVTVERMFEKSSIAATAKEKMVWLEVVANTVTAQIDTQYSVDNKPFLENLDRTNETSFEFQRTPVTADLFYEIYGDPYNVYNIKYVEHQGYVSLGAHLREIFTVGDQVRFEDFEAKGEDMEGEGFVTALAQRVYRTVSKLNYSFQTIRTVAEVTKEKNRLIVQGAYTDEIQRSQEEEVAGIIGVLAPAFDLVRTYPGAFVLTENNGRHELQLIIPTPHLNSLQTELIKPYEEDSKKTQYGMLHLLDGDDDQIAGNPIIKVSTYLKTFVEVVKANYEKISALGHRQEKTGDLTPIDEETVSPLRIVSHALVTMETWTKTSLGKETGKLIRDQLFIERLGMEYGAFNKLTMETMGITFKRITEEINKWKDLSRRENTGLKGVVTDTTERAVAQVGLPGGIIKVIMNTAGFFWKLAVPLENNMRTIPSLVYGAGVTASFVIGSLLAPAGTIVTGIAAPIWPAIIAGHLLVSLTSLGANLCMREYAIYGPKGSPDKSSFVRMLYSAGNSILKPFFRKKYAQYAAERESASKIEEMGLGKTIEAQLFTLKNIADLFNVSVNQLPRDLSAALIWFEDKKGFKDVPGCVFKARSDTSEEEKQINAEKKK